jgi:hypothetical protein
MLAPCGRLSGGIAMRDLHVELDVRPKRSRFPCSLGALKNLKRRRYSRSRRQHL